MRKIKGYENYSITRKGEIINTRTGRTLKKHISEKGYAYIFLSSKGKSKKFRVCRLVYLTYKGEISGEINHKDRNILNDSVTNLEDITGRENILHFMENKTGFTGVVKKGERKYRARITVKGKIYETTRTTAIKASEWYKQKAEELGLSLKYAKTA